LHVSDDRGRFLKIVVYAAQQDLLSVELDVANSISDGEMLVSEVVVMYDCSGGSV
jgi:hypothetical protein